MLVKFKVRISLACTVKKSSLTSLFPSLSSSIGQSAFALTITFLLLVLERSSTLIFTAISWTLKSRYVAT